MSFSPPITKKSSKEDMWEELECARAEIEQQQRSLNSSRDRVKRLEAEISSSHYQLDIIRAVMNGNVPHE